MRTRFGHRETWRTRSPRILQWLVSSSLPSICVYKVRLQRRRPYSSLFEQNSALSRALHQLPCGADDENRADHRSEDNSGAGGETRSDAGRIRANQENPRSRTELYRARDFFSDVERALLIQKFAAGAEKIPDDWPEYSGQSGRRKCRRG